MKIIIDFFKKKSQNNFSGIVFARSTVLLKTYGSENFLFQIRLGYSNVEKKFFQEISARRNRTTDTTRRIIAASTREFTTRYFRRESHKSARIFSLTAVAGKADKTTRGCATRNKNFRLFALIFFHFYRQARNRVRSLDCTFVSPPAILLCSFIIQRTALRARAREAKISVSLRRTTPQRLRAQLKIRPTSARHELIQPHVAANRAVS